MRTQPTQIRPPMPFVVVLAPFVGVIVPSAGLLIIKIIRGDDLMLPIVFFAVGVVLFALLYRARKRLWNRGLYRGTVAESVALQKIKKQKQ